MKFNPDYILNISVVLGALLLTRIPYIGKFFRLIDTLIHESAHALMALFFSGSVERIDLFSSTEGAAVTKSKGKFATIMISLAGYIGSSGVAFLLFYLLYHSWYNAVMYFFTAVCVINLLLWVRNGYGIFFLLLFGSMCGGVVYFDIPLLTRISSLLFTSLLWTDALVSSGIIFYLSMVQSKNAGDAHSLKQSTGIPAFIWGLLFMSQALGFSYLTLAMFFELPLPHFIDVIRDIV
jgi:hypothetical protein